MSWFMFLTLSLANVPAGAQTAYAKILKASVAKGLVNYNTVASMRDDLDRYLEAVGKAKVPAAKAKAMAFYIDAYNALVIRSVLDAGTPKSVLSVNDFFKKKSHQVAGKTVSLDQLEKEILNPLAKDPRTHMVLVCAAKGCPKLEKKPYTGSNLERRLEQASKRYLQSPAGARVSSGALSLSKIFEWYAADYGGVEGAIAFVIERLPAKKRELVGSSPKISYHDYNWQLNSR